ncbi:MAG: hypothetical protein ACREOB_12215 [Thermodesulfobacteriota bacterium]
MTILIFDNVPWVPRKRGVEAVIYNELVQELGDPSQFNLAFRQHSAFHKAYMLAIVDTEVPRSAAIIEAEFAKNIREWVFGPSIIDGELLD